MNVLRKALLVTAVTALPLASPAGADTRIGGGGATANRCSGLHCWVGVLTADVHPIGNTGLALVSWNCQGTGTVDPASTSITTCKVGNQAASPITLPGAFAATANASVFVVGSQVTACVAGQSAFVENVLGDQIVGASDCRPLVIATVPI